MYVYINLQIFLIVYFCSLLYCGPYFAGMWKQFVYCYHNKRMLIGKTRNNVLSYMQQRTGHYLNQQNTKIYKAYEHYETF